MANETLEISDAQFDKNSDAVSKLYRENRPLYEKASQVVNRLGLGGLWRGHDAAILIVAQAITS